MEFAAACLSAVACMTPDPAWTPPLGALFIRIVVAPWGDEICLGFADEPPKNGLQHYRSLARVRNWHAECDFGGNFDCAKGNLDTSHAAPIVRRRAGHDDVSAFLRLWDPDSFVTQEQWIAIALRERALSEDGKALLATTAARLGIVPAVWEEP